MIWYAISQAEMYALQRLVERESIYRCGRPGTPHACTERRSMELVVAYVAQSREHNIGFLPKRGVDIRISLYGRR